MQRALLTVVALWLPLLPFFFVMRHVIKERSGMYVPVLGSRLPPRAPAHAKRCGGAPPQG